MKTNTGIFRIGILISVIILVVAGVMMGIKIYTNREHGKPSSLLNELKNDIDRVPSEGLLNRIKFCEHVLENLQHEIDSGNLNPEEYHEALLTRQNIIKKLNQMTNELQNRGQVCQ